MAASESVWLCVADCSDSTVHLVFAMHLCGDHYVAFSIAECNYTMKNTINVIPQRSNFFTIVFFWQRLELIKEI